MAVKIGALLLRENMVTPQQLQEALSHQRVNGGLLSQAFVSLGFLADEEITSLLSRQYGVPSIDLDHFACDPVVLRIVPAETARKYQMLPLSRSKATLTVAMADPTNVFGMDDVKFMTGYDIEPVVASEARLEAAIERAYGAAQDARTGNGQEPVSPGADSEDEGITAAELDARELPMIDLDSIPGGTPTDEMGAEEIDLDDLSKNSNLAPVVKLVNVILVDALKRGGSEVHVEPYEKEFRVRFRIDGVLYNVMALPMTLRDPLISRFKTMARLDTTERRRPQEGRLRLQLRAQDRSEEMEFRVSTLPTLWGEKMVLQKGERSRHLLDPVELGFEPRALESFRGAIARPHGLVVIAGPLGSGKTTTLYAALSSLRRPDLNIVTLEDPATFTLPGVHQVALRADVGYDAGAALTSSLDHDPDVIAVDPIGDDALAQRLMRLGARSGRLVLATMLAGGGAAATLCRLANGAGSRWTLVRALRQVVAQRVIRRICPSCKVEADASPQALIESGFHPEEIGSTPVYLGKGCGACNGTGYRGRVGLYEVLDLSEGIRDLVTVGATDTQIRRKALEEGMLTLRMNGLEKMKRGLTTLQEVLRTTRL